MGSRKEEERNEKIIRGLMKLPPNRRCINCNSLGPQYVCTTFWTFVCTTCSGIHREFTHRVKSVSMAKFTSQEVEALENGGNQRAREMFLNGWDPQTQRFPDNSNAEKIRQFIKNAYVDKKYFAPKSSDKPPRHLQNSRSLDEENRRASSYHSYSQSPPYDFQYEERRYGKHPPGLSRKPGSDRGLYEGKFSSFSSSLSDRTFEGRFSPEGSNPRMSDFSASSGADHFRSSAQSPNYEKDVWSPSFGNRSHFSESTSTPSVDLFENSPNFVAPTFSAHQIVENSAASSLDLFSEMPSKLPSATDDEVSHGKVIPPNEGWATFDSQMEESVVKKESFEPIIPWSSFEEHVADEQPSSEPSIGQEGSRVVQSSSQWPSLTEFSARGESSSTPNGWNKNQQMIEAAPNKVETQSWNAFEDSTGELNSQSTRNEHLETQNRLVVDHNMEFGLPEDFTGELTQTNTVGPLGSSISHFMVPLEDLSMPVAGTYAIDHKPTNPFDLPYDSGLESNDMSQFWDMSSLQANLPDARMPASPSAEGLTQPWYNPDPVDPQGALGFMAQSTQIPNVHLQGPVASISGNPFA